MSPQVADGLFLFLHSLGVVLIFAAFLLYEDEEGKFQSKVESWWIRLSDKQKVSRLRVASFMQEVAKLTGRGFDRLLGKSLFSLRLVPVSIYLSLSSVFILVVIMWPRINHPTNVTRHEAFLMFVYFLALALVPGFVRSKWLLMLWWAIIPAVFLGMSGFLLFLLQTRGVRTTIFGIGLIALVFASSLVVDLFYVTLTRYILRRIVEIDRVTEIIIMLVLNLAALAVAVFGPIYAAVALTKYAPYAAAMIFVSLIFNFIDFLAGFAAFFAALLLLLHRLFWPAIQRPLYAVYRFAPIKEKKWLFRIGVVLILLPQHLTIEVLKKILEKL